MARADGRRPSPYPTLPILKLARLASDERERRKGIGKGLLRHALEVALRMSQQIGCVGVYTDAKPDSISFYTENEFVSLPTLDSAADTHPMFLSMRKIEAALEL